MKPLEQLGISPAPWAKYGKCTERGEVLAADQSLVLIFREDAGFDYDETTEANARLIAAAPELYEALRECVEELCDMCEKWTEYPCRKLGKTCDTVCKAKAALEKAGGNE